MRERERDAKACKFDKWLRLRFACVYRLLQHESEKPPITHQNWSIYILLFQCIATRDPNHPKNICESQSNDTDRLSPMVNSFKC